MGFAIAHTIRQTVPRLPFEDIKKKILGGAYELSVAFISSQKMRALNRRSRRIDASTDILSFPLSKETGEIYISLADAAKKAGVFGMTPRQYLGFLFIHGALHLKGMDHGKKMETEERRLCRQFGFPDPY